MTVTQSEGVDVATGPQAIERCGLSARHAEIAEMDDVVLVDAMTRRCADAYAEIHRRYMSSVVTMSQRFVHDRGVAEEVAQEVLLGLWLRPERFDAARRTLRAYLGTIARGRAIDRVRSDGARHARELRQGRAPAAGEGLDDTVIRILDAQRVRGALAGLPAEQRLPLELAFFEGHTYLAAAIVLGLPEGTVKSRVRAGLAALRALLAAERPILERPARPSLDQAASVEYRIDAADRVTPIGAGWAQFARENGAPELAAPSVTRTLWGYLEGDALGALWELLVLRVRLTQTPVTLPFRCDAPAFRRWFDMTLTPEPEDAIHFSSVLTREEAREAVDHTVAGPVHAARAVILVCSWCSRCDDGRRWTAFEDYARSRSVMGQTVAPVMTHGVCPSCADMVRAEIVEG